MAVKVTTNADPDKYKCFGYGNEFDASENYYLRVIVVAFIKTL